MAIILLLIGVILAIWGLRSQFKKDIMTALTAATILLIVLLIAGAPVPGELILLVLPTWIIALLRQTKGTAKRK